MKSKSCAGLAPLLAALALAYGSGAYAAGGDYSSGFDAEPISKLIDAGDCQKAIDRLHKASTTTR